MARLVKAAVLYAVARWFKSILQYQFVIVCKNIDILKEIVMDKSIQKKKLQLGMNPSTASHRLVKDLLYRYAVVTRSQYCYHCNKFMSREDFSVEHKTPWLDSNDPVGLYFDLENVTFSHLSCNVSASRQGNVMTVGHGTTTRYRRHGCRCVECTDAQKNAISKLRLKGRTAKDRRDYQTLSPNGVNKTQSCDD